MKDVYSDTELSPFLGFKGGTAAHKLIAMYQRAGKTNRDIFDVWYFLDNDWPINKEIIEKRTDLSFKKFLQKSIAALKEVPERQISSGMRELLREEQKRLDSAGS